MPALGEVIRVAMADGPGAVEDAVLRWLMQFKKEHEFDPRPYKCAAARGGSDTLRRQTGHRKDALIFYKPDGSVAGALLRERVEEILAFWNAASVSLEDVLEFAVGRGFWNVGYAPPPTYCVPHEAIVAPTEGE